MRLNFFFISLFLEVFYIECKNTSCAIGPRKKLQKRVDIVAILLYNKFKKRTGVGAHSFKILNTQGETFMKTNLTTIQEVMSAYPRLSLKRVCDEAGLCYQYVLKASKQPIANQTYDPTATNWSAIEAIRAKKEIDLTAIDWNAVNDSIVVFTPVNKPEDFKPDTYFSLRKDDLTYRVLLTTETHIVFMDVDGTQPRVMNWDTFQHQSPRIITIV